MAQHDIGFLRCSKLSCYAEFNKMVQSIAQHSDKLQASRVQPSQTTRSGTSAEYNFYRTLLIMLNQVVHNKNVDSQKQDLQLIYQWFHLNKPLTTQRVKPTVRKPKLAYSSPWQTSRPLTAPANISCERISPVCPPPTPSTFTSTYMKQCLSSNSTRPHTQPAVSSHSFTESVKPHHDTSESRNRIASGISIVELPSSTFDRPVTAGSVFNMASSVAAGMSLERMMVHSGPKLHTALRRISDRQPLAKPVTEKSAKENIAQQPEEDTKSCMTPLIEEDDERKVVSCTDMLTTPTVLTVHIGDSRQQSLHTVENKRSFCQPHVVTLSLVHQNNSSRRVRSPKPLTAVVAGFSKQRYRRRSVH